MGETLSEQGLVEAALDEELTAAVRASEYRCADCGYGAILRHTRPTCPMCGGVRWEEGAFGPAARNPAL